MKTLPNAGFEVPNRYHKDILQLMAKDAHTLYVYWEISNRKRWLVSQHFERDWNDVPKIVRIYDVTDLYFDGNNANYQFDVATTPEATNWYIHGLSAGRTFLADFGLYTWHGQFIPLLRSKAKATPRDAAVGSSRKQFALVPEPSQGTHHSRIQPMYFENIETYSSSRGAIP
jgi:hypothetical protein